eukprot:2186933-Amphidinium_carterae.1
MAMFVAQEWLEERYGGKKGGGKSKDKDKGKGMPKALLVREPGTYHFEGLDKLHVFLCNSRVKSKAAAKVSEAPKPCHSTAQCA